MSHGCMSECVGKDCASHMGACLTVSVKTVQVDLARYYKDGCLAVDKEVIIVAGTVDDPRSMQYIGTGLVMHDMVSISISMDIAYVIVIAPRVLFLV